VPPVTPAPAAPYYAGKLASLQDIFGTADVTVDTDRVVVNGRAYPVVDDVIVVLEPKYWPAALAGRLGVERTAAGAAPDRAFAEDIQFSFGDEWTTFSEILPEHDAEFADYFDLVDIGALAAARVCDFGCGIGRWSWYLAPKCREIVLVDFSEAIFVARRNLRSAPNALFFMGDVTALPFRDGFADFAFSLGVLHHLPVPALDAVRGLARFSPRLLVYLYYALDNRPAYFRWLLAMVTAARVQLARVRRPAARRAVSWAAAAGVYWPLVALGTLVKPLGGAKYVPLHEAYAGKSLGRIQQDAYDRLFTRIEQRVSRAEIMTLRDTFSSVRLSDNQPYWHFLCER
jgi:SAM-dependent methyltransferase